MARNVGGRPRGSRNKTKASSEIKQALSKGKGLLEFKQFLEDKMADEKISDVQMNKYLDKYWDLLKYIHTENLKLESPKDDEGEKGNSKKEISKGENTENSPSTSDTKVARLQFGSK